MCLSDDDGEEVDWVKDVWNKLNPLKMSTLIWKLMHNRLPTKDNLSERGVGINSSLLCVGGCGNLETATHVFFNCPVLSVCWREALKMVGIFDSLFGRWSRSSAYLQRPGSGGQGSGGKLVVWFSIAASIWKARNNIVFNMDGFHWEKVMEESKVHLENK
jgi:hypothetical protein